MLQMSRDRVLKELRERRMRRDVRRGRPERALSSWVVDELSDARRALQREATTCLT
jgi:hypothetical protein